MNEQAIAKAIVPEPWTILGLRLRPFSLGHLILLHRIESCFVVGGETSYDDLAVSVLICSQTFEDAVESFQSPDLPKFMRKWAHKLNKRGPINIIEKYEEFRAYINEGGLTSDDLYFTYNPQNTRPSVIPLVHAVRVKVQGGLHLSDSEILNRSWWLSYLDYHILQDNAGTIELCDKSDIDNARDVANRLQELIDKGEIKWQ